MKATMRDLVGEVPAVNFHLWQPCNMNCRFCFATFQDVKANILPKGHLPEAEAIAVVEMLATGGFRKINFAGGEPTLCPWLPKLIHVAHDFGMVTSIVTNGSRIDSSMYAGCSNCCDNTVFVSSSTPSSTRPIAMRT